jgi:hypothetical protein
MAPPCFGKSRLISAGNNTLATAIAPLAMTGAEKEQTRPTNHSQQ